MQTLSNLGETVMDITKSVAKKSLRPKEETFFGNEAPHAQRSGNISAFIHGIASMAKNRRGRHMEITLQT